MVRDKIANYIKTKGIKQEYVASKTGLSPVAISYLVNGKRNLDVEEYILICVALGVSYDYFMPIDLNIPNTKIKIGGDK